MIAKRTKASMKAELAQGCRSCRCPETISLDEAQDNLCDREDEAIRPQVDQRFAVSKRLAVSQGFKQLEHAGRTADNGTCVRTGTG